MNSDMQVVVWTTGSIIAGLTFIMGLIRFFGSGSKDSHADNILKTTQMQNDIATLVAQESKANAIFQTRQAEEHRRLIEMADKALNRVYSNGTKIDDLGKISDRTHRRVGEIEAKVGLIANEVYSSNRGNK